VIAPAILLTYAVIVGSLGGRVLAKARWTQRSPRLGIWTWQALTASIVLATVLAGATLAVPTLPVSTSLAMLLDACQQAILEQYSTPGGAAVSSSGALLVLAVAARLCFAMTAECISTCRRRRKQHRSLMLVTGRHATTAARVLPHTAPAVYCLPGRPGIIVLTSSAVATLDDHQLRAVLAHERAHLRNRHHLILTAAAALRKAYPFVPAFTTAQAQLQRLVEMHADDAACRHHDRKVLATALVTLAEGAIPAAAIGAGGCAAQVRVQRLAKPADPMSLWWSMLVSGTALTMLMLPIVTAVGPAMVAAILDYCPLVLPSLKP
jgi:Zn-dependent protease with chaperone function